jgi:hypothetical protein
LIFIGTVVGAENPNMLTEEAVLVVAKSTAKPYLRVLFLINSQLYYEVINRMILNATMQMEINTELKYEGSSLHLFPAQYCNTRKGNPDSAQHCGELCGLIFYVPL